MTNQPTPEPRTSKYGNKHRLQLKGVFNVSSPFKAGARDQSYRCRNCGRVVVYGQSCICGK